jgi:hypothetical protein
MRRLAPLAFALLTSGCVSVAGGTEACDPDAPASRFISCVLSFAPGAGAGHGQDDFPAIIEGPPAGLGTGKGSLDTLSLGRGGEIAFGFGGGTIVDGDGPDFIVFENAFLVGGDPTNVFKELGEVSVSADGVSWTTFPCHTAGYPYTGCAGWHPVLATAASGDAVFDPARAGGDPFDLRDVGLSSARFVKIHDVSNYGSADNAGFDLDAAAVIHPGQP